MTLEARFGNAVSASGTYLPLAASLAFAGLASSMFVTWLASTVTSEPIWVLLPWLVFSHAAFVAYLCAYIGTGEMKPRARAAHAWVAARRGLWPMMIWTTLLVPLIFASLPLMLVWWVTTCMLAAPARLIESGWRGWSRLFEPMPVPAWQRLLLLTPSFVVLLGLSSLLAKADFGIMDGGMIAMPLTGAMFLWTFYSAALFPAHFAWEVAFDESGLRPPDSTA